MKRSQFIGKLPEALAEEIRDYVLDIPGVWSEARVDLSLEELLNDREVLERMFQSLRETEIRTLRLILTGFAGEPFDEARLVKAGREQLSGAALKVGLNRLCRKGVVFTLRKAWGEQLYMLPTDRIGLWAGLLAPFEAESYLAEEGATVVPLREEQPVPPARLLSLLAYAEREGLPLTQKGTLVKRTVTRLQQLLGVDGSVGARPPLLRYKGEEAYPFPLAAVLDAALRLQLLHADAECYRLNERMLAEWLSLSEAEMNRQLYGLLSDLLPPPADPMIRNVIACAEELPTDRWFRPEAISAGLVERGLTGAGVGPEPDKLLVEWLKPAEALGFLELGRAEDGGWLARWRLPASGTERQLAESIDTTTTITGTSTMGQKAVFILPDFEIIVPPAVPYSIRWELERHTELEQPGAVCRYRLTKERIIRSLELGADGARILELLHDIAKYGVPEPVEYTLKDWIAQYGRTSIESAVLFRCRDEATAEEMEVNPKLLPHLRERLGPLVWLVEPGASDLLLEQLQMNGYIPAQANAGTNAADDPVATASQMPFPADSIQNMVAEPAGLIYSRQSVQYYDIERTIPPTEELYPGLTEVPGIWLKECRAYHAATRMDMIRKALEWKASVRLRQGGQDRVLVPEKVEGTKERWQVLVRHEAGEATLGPEQWDEMQLVLPGINDDV
ncbi:helicase-associated domain-containing protein [Paenibacillus koleovorans]|uniref:helicase-associated domain-containing protein n=1 Tax=Paenibacillus koleovorans TaxID=121608 RepID=UPI000FDA67B7|nr:helicase-associated domain-containing protein [Paenibacillus koleovorans]